MTDDANLTNLEDDGPETPPAAPVAETTPEQTPPVAATTEADEIDPNDADLLKDEGRVKGLLAELARKRAENKELKTKAQRVEEIEQWAQQNRPYVEFIQQNPDFLKRQQQPQPVQEPAKPADDPDAIEAAKLMDFYTADGKPDTERGRKWLDLQDRRANKAAQAAVQPWEQQTMQERSNQNFYRVLQMQDADGNKPSEQAVRAVWSQVLQDPGGLKITSDPRAATFLALAAIGADRMTKKAPPQPPAKEPVITEPSGGNTVHAAKLTPLEETIARARGVQPAKWQELTKGYRPGRTNVIEED